MEAFLIDSKTGDVSLVRETDVVGRIFELQVMVAEADGHWLARHLVVYVVSGL